MATRVAEAARRLTASPAIPVLIAIVLGLWRIGDKSLWLDEAFSFDAAHLPANQLFSLVAYSEMNAAAYYATLHGWLVLGTSEQVIRSLSVLFGALAVAGTFYVGRRYGVGFGAALILAVFPYFIQYEQETRPYAMLMAGSALTSLAYLRMVDLPRASRVVTYILLATLMIYVHLLGALVVAAQGVHFLFVVRPDLRRLAVTYVPVGVAWIPMILFSATHRDKVAFIPATDLEHGTAALLTLAGGAGGLVLAGVVICLLVLGGRRDYPTLWLIVPLAATFAITWLIQPVVQALYLVAALPAGAVIVARNRVAALALLVGLCLVGDVNWYVNAPKADWRSAGAWVAESVQPGDGIVFAPGYMRIPFGYYARVGEPLYLVRPWSADDIGGGRYDTAEIATYHRIWLVEGHARELPDDVRATLATFTLAEARDYGGANVRVELLERP